MIAWYIGTKGGAMKPPTFSNLLLLAVVPYRSSTGTGNGTGWGNRRLCPNYGYRTYYGYRKFATRMFSQMPMPLMLRRIQLSLPTLLLGQMHSTPLLLVGGGSTLSGWDQNGIYSISNRCTRTKIRPALPTSPRCGGRT